MDIKSYYDKDYHSRRHGNLIGDEEYFWARAAASQKLYFSHLDTTTTRILDFGGGIGQTVAGLPNASVFDASAEAREICRSRGLGVYERVEDIPDASFDIVVCRHVLEHVPHPAETLRHIRRVLKGDGTLILILPKEPHGHYGLRPDMVNYHLHCWNFRSINNLLDFTGFRSVEHRQHYILGYRALLPLKRIFGFSVYYVATFIVGQLYRMGEIIIHAQMKHVSTEIDL